MLAYLKKKFDVQYFPISKKHKYSKSLVSRSIIGSMLCLLAQPASALLVDIGGEIITDNGEGDMNRAVGTIGFSKVLPTASFGASGTLTEVIAKGAATLTFTDLVIGHTGFGGTIKNNISFQSSMFDAIGPVVKATARLNGSYGTVGPAGGRGNRIADADIQFAGFVNGNGIIGQAIDPPGVANGRAYIVFFPEDEKAIFNFGVTSLSGSLPFQLGNTPVNGIADGIFLRSGLSVSVTAVPVPAAIWLLGSAIIGLAGIARRPK